MPKYKWIIKQKTRVSKTTINVDSGITDNQNDAYYYARQYLKESDKITLVIERLKEDKRK